MIYCRPYQLDWATFFKECKTLYGLAVNHQGQKILKYVYRYLKVHSDFCTKIREKRDDQFDNFMLFFSYVTLFSAMGDHTR